MRVYNGTNSQVDLPLSGSQRITIPSHSVSGDIMPSTEFLSLLVGSYDYSELALIVSGPFEINMCAGVSGCVGFVCQSLEEAIEKFSKDKEDKKEEIKESSNENINNSSKDGEGSSEAVNTPDDSLLVKNSEDDDVTATTKIKKAKPDKKVKES